MRKPLIFSGTTEGRKMSERLSAAGIDHIVCVATGYGELVMQQDRFADIRQGRLTAPEMEKLMAEEASSVYDATHPYAAAVSENIREACKAAEVPYVRILRPVSGNGHAEGIRSFADAGSCAEALKETAGNILLTTGSKELGIYAADPEVRERLFARVLPSAESIDLCTEAGLQGRQIIAMQGPFTKEMDLAVIRQYGISILVTKSSGRAGGFEEKVSAAAEAGILTYVIGRPADEDGITVNEALRRDFGIAPHMHIDLVGTGPGRKSLMTEEAAHAVKSADMVFGAARMTEPYGDMETYPYYLAKDIIPVLADRRPERIAVLFSGDTGFFSGAAGMKPALEEWLGSEGYEFSIGMHPGISSFAYMAAKCGVPYAGAGLISLHGRSGDSSAAAELTEMVKLRERTFVLLSGAGDVRLLGELLSGKLSGSCTVVLGKDLSYPGESISRLTPEECCGVTDKGLYIALVINSAPETRELLPVLSDETFTRGDVPMTKENVRHLSIIRMGLGEDSVVWDIGSGTGSVACEIAAAGSRVRVCAVEMKDEACSLIRQNAAKLDLANVEIIQGRAPEALASLETPSHAFIGGSTGSLREILEVLKERSSERPDGIRVVINAVSLETMAEISAAVRDTGASDVLIEQISVSRSRKLGSHHLMTAENPVMIASFTLGGTP